MYQISPERKLFLPCRGLLCEACWAKGYLENKVLEYGIILLFLNPVSKEALIAVVENSGSTSWTQAGFCVGVYPTRLNG